MLSCSPALLSDLSCYRAARRNFRGNDMKSSPRVRAKARGERYRAEKWYRWRPSLRCGYGLNEAAEAAAHGGCSPALLSRAERVLDQRARESSGWTPSLRCATATG